MRLALTCHPDTPSTAVSAIAVEVARPRTDRLHLRYLVGGDLARLRLPPPTAPKRTDELWRHTCFEAFLRASGGEAYYEFNFSPSGEWAAYEFSGYRSGMTVVSKIGAPRIGMRMSERDYHLDAELELGGLLDLPLDASWRLGLSAVIEDKAGVRSYWALAHPPGKPDFHHADAFAFELPAGTTP